MPKSSLLDPIFKLLKKKKKDDRALLRLPMSMRIAVRRVARTTLLFSRSSSKGLTPIEVSPTVRLRWLYDLYDMIGLPGGLDDLMTGTFVTCPVLFEDVLGEGGNPMMVRETGACPAVGVVGLVFQNPRR